VTDTARPGRVYGGQSAAGRDAERRERLLTAGLEAFGTNGFQGTTIEQLCTAAGVATRSFYDLFASREALLIALHDDINASALDAIVQALSEVDSDDLHARAAAAFSAYLDVITTDPRWVRITLRETVGASPATYAARRDALGRFASFLQLELDRLGAAGAIPQRDHTLTAVAIVGGLTALVESLLPPDQPPRALSRSAVDRVREAGVRLILSAGTELPPTP
jgi:AcrR family transcriptional regulator